MNGQTQYQPYMMVPRTSTMQFGSGVSTGLGIAVGVGIFVLAVYGLSKVIHRI